MCCHAKHGRLSSPPRPAHHRTPKAQEGVLEAPIKSASMLLRRQARRTLTAAATCSRHEAVARRSTPPGPSTRRCLSAMPSSAAEDDKPLIPGIGRGKTSTGLVGYDLWIFSLSRGWQKVGGGKKLPAREFGRSQQRRSRSCSDAVNLTFVPSAFAVETAFLSKNSARRDSLMTQGRRNARSYSIRNSSFRTCLHTRLSLVS
jgi:hypothetical protein